jgi:hypothetical protein
MHEKEVVTNVFLMGPLFFAYIYIIKMEVLPNILLSKVGEKTKKPPKKWLQNIGSSLLLF